MKLFFLGTFFLHLSMLSFSQKLSDEEIKLYNLIMEYRKQLSLPPIPISSSLTFVAQTHINDLQVNKPNQLNCNMHSWSSNGSWIPCCYTPDHAQANCMWSKPKELTSYPGNGYEIACGSDNSTDTSFAMTAVKAIESWKNSPGHNAVITNQNIWKNLQWNAIGIALKKGYALVWFGTEPDKQSDPELLR